MIDARHIRPILFLLLVAVLNAWPVDSYADFRHGRMGPRPRAMGSAFVSISDDANAVYWNPAGMVQLEDIEITGCRTMLFEVSELSYDYIASALNWDPYFAFGISWVRLELEDIYYENTINIGIARKIPGIEGLAAGVALKFYTLAAPGYEKYNDPAYTGRVTKPSFDLGLHYRMKDRPFSIGAVVYNINEPGLQLLSTTDTPDPVYRDYALGMSYIFRELLLMAVDIKTRYGDLGDITGRFGTEIWFFDAVALRGGFERHNMTAGIGLKGNNWQVDMMLETHYDLGNSYQFGLTIRF